jgi:hypothetical protein
MVQGLYCIGTNQSVVLNPKWFNYGNAQFAVWLRHCLELALLLLPFTQVCLTLCVLNGLDGGMSAACHFGHIGMLYRGTLFGILVRDVIRLVGFVIIYYH